MKCLVSFFHWCLAIIPFNAILFMRTAATILTTINCIFSYITGFCFLCLRSGNCKFSPVFTGISICVGIIIHVFDSADILLILSCFRYFIVRGLYKSKLAILVYKQIVLPGVSIKVCFSLFISFAINHAFSLREIYIINIQPYQFTVLAIWRLQF